MKKLLFPLFMVCAAAIISCKKEVTTEESQTSNVLSASSEESLITSGPHFGGLIHQIMSTDDKIKVLKAFGVTYARASTFLKDFKGKDGPVDNYLSKGFKVIQNLNYASTQNGKVNPFPTDMVTYKKLLSA